MIPVRNPVIKFTGHGEDRARIVAFVQNVPLNWFPGGPVRTQACIRTVNSTVGGCPAGAWLNTQVDMPELEAGATVRILWVAVEVPPLADGEVLECELVVGATPPVIDNGNWWDRLARKKITAQLYVESEPTKPMELDVGAFMWRDIHCDGPLLWKGTSKVKLFGAPMPNTLRFNAPAMFTSDGGLSIEPTLWCENDPIPPVGRVVMMISDNPLDPNYPPTMFDSGAVSFGNFTFGLKDRQAAPDVEIDATTLNPVG